MESAGAVLERKVALVTGGGRGIGRAISVGLAGIGARVAVLARSADEVAATSTLVEQRHAGSALAVPADVDDPEQVGAALALIDRTWGPVEILVNNAAVVWPLGPSTEVDPLEWAAALAINVTAVARLTFSLLPAMYEAGWGRVVNVSSGNVAHPAGMVRANAYVTTKAALEAHTLNLAAETAGTGVTVNAYLPGGVDTAMQAWIRAQDPDRVGEFLHRRFVDNHEQGALLSPERSAASLLARLPGPQSGQIWDATDPFP